MKKILIILTVILLASCSLHRGSKYQYIVKAGHHYAEFTPVIFLSSNIISYEFKPDSSWIWQKPVKNGWSKLTGIAWGDNHQNSIRLVYMRLNDSVGVLGCYAYVNGISPMENWKEQAGIMDTIVIGRKYKGEIGWAKGNYFVTVNGRADSVKTNVIGGIRTLCRPYIGGTYTINHTWHVTLKYNER